MDLQEVCTELDLVDIPEAGRPGWVDGHRAAMEFVHGQHSRTLWIAIPVAALGLIRIL